MDTNTKNVKDFFDSYAGDFDAIYGHTNKRNAFGRWVDKSFRQVMFKRFEETLQHTNSSHINSILDVGCGSGRYLVEFLRQDKAVTGLDMAPGMIDIAKNITSKIEHNGSIDLVVGDYLQYQFNQQFDAACLMGFFDYIEQPADVFNKLKQDVSKEIYASFPKSGGLLAWQRRVRYKMRNCPLYLYSKKDVEDIMRQCNINNYSIKDFGRGLFLKVDL